MRKYLYIGALILGCLKLQAQVPSANQLVKVHELTTLQGDTISNLQFGMLSYNSDNDLLMVYTGTTWNQLAIDKTLNNELVDSLNFDADSMKLYQNNGSQVVAETAPRTFMGKFIIDGTGNITISGLPFRPSYIEFAACANVDTLVLSADNEIADNDASKDNVFGSMKGYVQEYNGSVTQQSIFIGGSGRSINDISRFAQNTHCIGLRYCNTNGDNLGETKASFVSFQDDGFIINVTSAVDDVLILFTAHR